MEIFNYLLNTASGLDATLAFKTDYKSTIVVEIARVATGDVVETRHFEDGALADKFANWRIKR
jgi:hypothetical protein